MDAEHTESDAEVAVPAATDEYLVALTTVGSEQQALELVRGLVEERLVACGTILPGARSVYRWQGALADEREVVVLLKSSRRRWEALRAWVEAHHPYQVPELLALPVSAGLDRYLAWVTEETR